MKWSCRKSSFWEVRRQKSDSTAEVKFQQEYSGGRCGKSATKTLKIPKKILAFSKTECYTINRPFVWHSFFVLKKG